MKVQSADSNLLKQFLPANVTLDPAQSIILTKLINILKERDQPQGWLSFFKSKIKVGNDVVRGIYLYGSVGSGKTMLMKAIASIIKAKKQIIHYQDLMQTIHQGIHQIKEKVSKQQIVTTIASNYAQKINYLFLDEFEIKDITDAMIIGPLFQELMRRNIFIFLTTNTSPDNLYLDGLQRELFLPFIQNIKDNFEMIALNCEHDYRIDKFQSEMNQIFYPINNINLKKIEKIIISLTHNVFSPCFIEAFGHKIHFTSSYDKTLVTDDEELFKRDLSYIDYIKICSFFDIIIIKKMHIINKDNTNLATRFINFIDNAYFYKVQLFMLLETHLEKIYEDGIRRQEFKRTISRLHEMNSKLYQSKRNV